MRTYVTKENLKNVVTLAEYQCKEVNYAENLTATISAAGVPVSLMFGLSEYDGKKHYGHYAIFLNGAPEGLRLQINKRDHEKQFSIFSYLQYEYCDNSTCHEIKQKSGLVEPQNIGVLTAKKVKNWISYESELHALYAERAAQNREKIDLFLQSIRDLEATFQPLRNHVIYSNGVRWYKDGLSGCVENNGLEFTFECNKGTGYISQRIKISASNTLENFIALSTNKYTPETY